jgi:hypothetical protein
LKFQIPSIHSQQQRQNVSFVVTTKDLGGITRSLTILIADGNYTISELISEIQDQLNAGLRNPYGIFINIALDVNSGKITITCQGLIAVWSSGAVPNYENYPVTFDFSTPRPTTRHGGIGIGYNLGFQTGYLRPKSKCNSRWAIGHTDPLISHR